MKILVIAPTPFFAHRGTHQRIWGQARALADRGHDVCIITYHVGDRPPVLHSRIIIKRIPRLLWWYQKLDAGPSWWRIILDIQVFILTVQTIIRLKPDIIHTHLHEGAIIAVMARYCLFWRVLPLCIDLHGSLTSEMQSHGYARIKFVRRMCIIVERYVAYINALIITSSYELANDLRQIAPQQKIVMFLDGIDMKQYKNLPMRVDTRNAYRLPLDAFIVGYTGAFLENKGINLLIDVIALTHRHNMIFVCAGNPAKTFHRTLRQRSCDDMVRIISPLREEDLSSVLATCDVLIDPKNEHTRQGSGKILAYMAAGKPILCCDRPTNRAYCGRDAIYCSNDPQEFVDALIVLRNDVQQREQLGSALRKSVMKFDWKEHIKILEQYYFYVRTR